MNKEIEKIKLDLEIEGYKPESPEFEFQLLERRVFLCQEKHFVSACQGCSYFDECTLVKTYAIQKRYGLPKK